MSHSTGRLLAAVLSGIEDATIGTIISWLALKEKLPSAQSLSSLGMLIAHTLTGLHLNVRSALCVGWTHIAARR